MGTDMMTVPTILLRDYIAVHATQDDIEPYLNYYAEGCSFTRTIPEARYKYADAMLDVRLRGNPIIPSEEHNELEKKYARLKHEFEILEDNRNDILEELQRYTKWFNQLAESVEVMREMSTSEDIANAAMTVCDVLTLIEEGHIQ